MNDPNWYRQFDPDQGFGSLGLVIPNPLRGQRLAVPHDVRLGDTPEGEPAILWKIPPENLDHPTRHDWRDGGEVPDAFQRFLKLRDETRPEKFVDFVRRFGPLGLWPYVLPGTTREKVLGMEYWVPSIPDSVQTPYRYTVMHSGEEERYLRENGLLWMMYEPVSEYRRWSRWVNAAFEIAGCLKAHRPAPRASWTAADNDLLFDIKTSGWAEQFPTNVRAQRIWYTNMIQSRFIKWSGIVPVLRWADGPANVGLALGGRWAVTMPRASMVLDWPENILFPALTALLLAFTCGSWNLASCSRCGELFPTKRKPLTDQPHYREQCKLPSRRDVQNRSARRTRARRAQPLIAAQT
jgi:hypothetical protein